MKVLQVNQSASRGGAAGVCLTLHNALQAGGHDAAIFVGRKTGDIPGVTLIDHDVYRSRWGRSCMAVARRLERYVDQVRGAQRISCNWLPRLASPRRIADWWTGHEEFDFPGTRHLLEHAPFIPDVLHLHNLHGAYFDLRELPCLSHTIPTIITMHDAWLLAGHCSHSFDCERWTTGCGSCPRLDIPPALPRDGSAFNWQRKHAIFEKSRFSLVCPSQWLADKVRRSMLMQGANRLDVIPNGVDTSKFRPGDKAEARELLGWPQEAFIVIFAADGVRQSIWKDFSTMREAVRLASERDAGRPVHFFAIGDTAPAEQIGSAKIEFLPYRDSLAECYQAADVYLHAAKADTFPGTIIESLACATPVVATAVGGISEQVIEGKTGFLVPAGDAAALAARLESMAQSPEMVLTMGAAGRLDVVLRFSLERMMSRYMRLYQEIVQSIVLNTVVSETSQNE